MDFIDGHYVNAGEKALYLKPIGVGDPPVVIETDWGGLSIEWTAIQRALAEKTTVISYDRAGYGESQKGEKPRSAINIANELFTALGNVGVPGPYIFVGHSAGAFYSMQFAKTFPDYVAGLVLVDPMTPYDKEFDKLDAPAYQEIASIPIRMNNLRKYLELDPEQFEQMITPMLREMYDNAQVELKEHLIMYQSDLNLYASVVDEYEARDESFDTFNIDKSFPNVPLTLLCRDYKAMIKLGSEIGVPEEESRMVEELWLELCKRILGFSTNSSMSIVEGADHNIHHSRPDAIVAAVSAMIDKVKNS